MSFDLKMAVINLSKNLRWLERSKDDIPYESVFGNYSENQKIIASLLADVNIGDVRGAFCISDPLARPEGRLFSTLPQGGIPGVDISQLMEVIRHLYGLNSAPPAWQKKATDILLGTGFVKSSGDENLFFFDGPGGNLAKSTARRSLVHSGLSLAASPTKQ